MPAIRSRLTTGLSAEDLAKIKDLKRPQVQKWCLMEVDRCRGRIESLRVLSDSEIEDDLTQVQIPELQGVDVEDRPGAAISKIQHYKAYIRALRSLYNAAAPINHVLPIEVLMEIFGNLPPLDFIGHRSVYMLRVCRFWTDVLYNTPQFWVNALGVYLDVASISNRRLDRFRLALDHSSTLRLKLSFRGLPVTLAEVLYSHADRISELHIDIAVSAAGLQLLLKANMPALRRLSITPKSSHHMSRGRWQSEYVELPSLTLVPALRSIRVTGPHFTVSLASASLRHIDLIPCWCKLCLYSREGGGPDFNALLRALAECVSLNTLRLTKCLPRNYNQARLQELSPPGLYARLPQLQYLFIHDLPEPMSSFLSRLIFSTSTSLEIMTYDVFMLPAPYDMQVLDSISTAERVVLNFKHRSGYRDIRLMEAYVQERRLLSVMSAEGLLSDDDDMDAYYTPYIHDVSKLFQSATTITSLVVVGMRHRVYTRSRPPYPDETQSVDRWSTLLGTFTSLTHLVIGQNSDDFPLVLHALCQDGGPADLEARCICPSIRALSCIWLSEAIPPWVDTKLLESNWSKTITAQTDEESTCNSDDEFRWPGEKEWRQRCNRIRAMREASGVHVESEDKVTWLPYGVAETGAFVAGIAPLLARRMALGAAQVEELHIQIRQCSELRSDSGTNDRDRQYLLRHLPAGPLENRVAALLNGLVERVIVSELEPGY